MLQISLYNENNEFVKLNDLKTQFLTDSYNERPGRRPLGKGCSQSLGFESKRTGRHPDRSWNVQDNCHNGMSNFCQALDSPNFYFPHQDASCQQSLELESKRTRSHPDRSVWDTYLDGLNIFCDAI